MRTATVAERRDNMDAAAEGKHQRRVAQAAANAVRRRRLIWRLLRFEDVAIFLTRAEWVAWKTQVRGATYTRPGINPNPHSHRRTCPPNDTSVTICVYNRS